MLNTRTSHRLTKFDDEPPYHAAANAATNNYHEPTDHYYAARQWKPHLPWRADEVQVLRCEPGRC
jgi:hypothetical protein